MLTFPGTALVSMLLLCFAGYNFLLAAGPGGLAYDTFQLGWNLNLTAVIELAIITHVVRSPPFRISRNTRAACHETSLASLEMI